MVTIQLGDYPPPDKPYTAVFCDKVGLSNLVDQVVAAGNSLTITMPCGSCVELKSEQDIPDQDLVCTCGNPEHWVIKYKES